MKLEIHTQDDFDNAMAKGLFAIAASVLIANCDFVKAVPAFDKATSVRLENLPQVTAIPAFDKATYVRLKNLPLVTVNNSAFRCN